MQEFEWEKDFLNSVPSFEKAGLEKAKAVSLLNEYIQLSKNLPIPPILDFSHKENLELSPYLARDEKIHGLMLDILGPLLQNFDLEGKENFINIIPFLQTTGVTIVSNHLSHFDSAVLYALLYREEEFREIASKMFFLAGRLVFLSSFSNVAARMFNATMVASPRDLEENQNLKKELTRLNIRSFKEAKARQKNGEILILFPEGTRSRTGEMGKFHSAVLNYLENTIVLPASLIGPETILQSESFTFGFTKGKMVIGEPLFVGARKVCPLRINGIFPEEITNDNKKQAIMDELGKKVALNLPNEMKGNY
ncbi:MAG: 1-acyl-sn-glycerol-3-phosphate acyltransferase [Leptospiraceae bacterium]|nr:1-acyl-sn-glycerol-3-phosphate acyltransferase [Leptospiraceae bacterium]